MKYLFLDRDGTIIKNYPYNNNPKYLEIKPGVFEALKKFQNVEYEIFVVSNQSAIANGTSTVEELKNMTDVLDGILKSQGITVSDYFYCQHSSEWKCNCRKPLTGLVDHLFSSKIVNLNQSYMIGDSMSDIEFANNLKINSILLSEQKIDSKSFLSATSWFEIMDIVEIS